MKIKPNIICNCGAKYNYDGVISQGALYCFNCGREIISSIRYDEELTRGIRKAIIRDNPGTVFTVQV